MDNCKTKEISSCGQNMIAVRIARKFYETNDICSLKLVSTTGTALPAFSAGAHIDVQIQPELRRSYSLCNSPGSTDYYEIAVLRDPNSRGGSIAIHESFHEGDEIMVSVPANHFPLSEKARKSLLLAGGIGVTPMLAMAQTLKASNQDFEFHYCGRSKSKMAFLDRIQASGYAEHCHLHFDDVESNRFDADAVLALPRRDKHLYVCGPTGFLEFVLDNARKAGWNDINLHYEYFGADVIYKGDDVAFEVQIGSTGQVLTVPPGKTVISVLKEHGYDVHVSCEQGVCGSCVMKIKNGVPDHRDHFLTAGEKASNKVFLPCVSRSKSSCMTLDI